MQVREGGLFLEGKFKLQMFVLHRWITMVIIFFLDKCLYCIV